MIEDPDASAHRYGHNPQNTEANELRLRLPLGLSATGSVASGSVGSVVAFASCSALACSLALSVIIGITTS